MKKHIWVIGTILTIGWMLLIFYFSSQTSNEIDMHKSFLLRIMVDIFVGKKFHTYPIEKQNLIISNISFYLSKTAHFIEYGILCYFCFLMLFCLKKYQLRYIISIIICFVYAISDEYHQTFSFGRTPRVQDVLIDVCGAITMVLIIETIRTIIQTKRIGKRYD